MIQRYTLLLSGGMAIFEEGEYVLYEDYLTALAKKDKEIELLNPCNHTGFESISCQICGYPDSRKLIAALKAELHQQYEESIAIIHDQGAENISLKQDLALNAKMLAHQTDLAREAETEASRFKVILRRVAELAEAKEMKSPLASSCPTHLITKDGFEPIHPMLREGLRIAAAIAKEALK